MKKIILVAACALLLAACDNKATKNEAPPRSDYDSLVQVINQKDAELNDIMGTFNDIRNGLNEIGEAEGRITLESADPEKASKTQVKENIDFIRRTMQLNREMITRLRQQLKGSSFNTTKLQETIDNLSQELEAKATKISELQAQLETKNLLLAQQDEKITTLNTNVNNLTSENEEKKKTVEAQDKELNTAWYVFGTKKELKDQKIVQSGNVLKSGTFNKDYFTKVDIRVDKIVKLYSKSAKLLTSHPAGSYSLDKDSNGQYTLRISNPTQFWSVSRYLVILVK
ncbi:MAG: hypothetical protein RR386_08635 [Bacteroidaceae bacterium]